MNARQAPMTDKAKAERREATLKAAEARTKKWDKRLNKGRQASQAKTTTDGVSRFRLFCLFFVL